MQRLPAWFGVLPQLTGRVENGLVQPWMKSSWPFWLAFALLAGCKLDPLSKDRCRTDLDCLVGQLCHAGRCEAPAGIDGTAPEPDARTASVDPPDAPALPDAPDVAADAAPPADLPGPDLPPPGQRCGDGGACPFPYICLGAVCQTAPLNTPCYDDVECSSGHCTDGVCCESRSCGPCRSCRVKEFEGFCQVLPKTQRDAGCPGL